MIDRHAHSKQNTTLPLLLTMIIIRTGRFDQSGSVSESEESYPQCRRIRA
jgi:hypothetical protein